jgi:hypothetical protein
MGVDVTVLASTKLPSNAVVKCILPLLYFEVLMEESVKGREKIGMNFLDGLIMEFSKQEQTNAFILVSTKTWKIQIQ